MEKSINTVENKLYAEELQYLTLRVLHNVMLYSASQNTQFRKKIQGYTKALKHYLDQSKFKQQTLEVPRLVLVHAKIILRTKTQLDDITSNLINNRHFQYIQEFSFFYRDITERIFQEARIYRLYTFSLGLALLAWAVFYFVSRLNEAISQHQFAKVKLDKLNEKLENKVELRTKQLKENNETLQASKNKLEIQTEKLLFAKDYAEQATKAKNSFIANMSHELRTPLNAIIGYSEMLEDTINDDEHQDECSKNIYLHDLEKITVSAHHLLKMVNRILDLSAIESGETTLNVKTFKISRLLSNMQNQFTPLFQQRHNQFYLHNEFVEDTIRSDEIKLSQVLGNIIDNANKFTINGEIHLYINQVSEQNRLWWRFKISDTGIGISPKQHKKLFQPFSQADASFTRQHDGCGLGLNISRRLIELLGGYIELNKAQEKGCSFAIYCPVYVNLDAN
jgi:signal transduction histidine kinase